MTILVDADTRVVVHGITGKQGNFHTKLMKDYGTNVVAGVSPGKGGQEIWGVPVYDSAKEAIRAGNANTSILYVPAPSASRASLDAIEAGVKLLVIITEGIPPLDTMRVIAVARSKDTRVVGPNCPGIISPGSSKVGIMPAEAFSRGATGIMSRSGTLTYEIAWAMTKAGLGQSTVAGLGGDAVIGTNFIDALTLMRQDPETTGVVIVGEIGGDDEERCAEFIADTSFDKPVIAYVAGRSAPSEKRMGHAGAIISGGHGDYESKAAALSEAGVQVAERPSDITRLAKSMFR